LAETIRDGHTGFLFSEPSSISFMGAVCRAFGTFGRKSLLNVMRGKAMSQSFEWSKSALSYRTLYEGLGNRRAIA
jgi:starch synthase